MICSESFFLFFFKYTSISLKNIKKDYSAKMIERAKIERKGK